ncbi:hypothetical protein NDU88_001302 [Pleurodeles waltl]|uniref:Uncharacterized protein n=1 Tax=Pleurodeles waltl TaxID=8319 RepID=A0AAV7MJC0_PLEWA|nr:hypothetical protein NDU88_001302 [Pleurodeles waltl]
MLRCFSAFGFAPPRAHVIDSFKLWTSDVTGAGSSDREADGRSSAAPPACQSAPSSLFRPPRLPMRAQHTGGVPGGPREEIKFKGKKAFEVTGAGLPKHRRRRASAGSLCL